MTRDFRPSRQEPMDDAAIEQLVRDVAAGWTMPPVRLDAPSWRDRVRSPGARRIQSLRGLVARVGQAATAAVALSVFGALLAVMILRPPNGPGQSPDATNRATNPAPSTAAYSPLSPLHRPGEVPNPAKVLVELEQGDFALVDLATGERSASLTDVAYGSVLGWRTDGLLCLCVKVASEMHGQPTEAEISIDRFDLNGTPTTSTPVMSLAGEPDPRDGALPERPPHLAFDVRFSDGGHYAFIGWSVRANLVWRSGVTVVDLREGTILSEITLPEETAGEGDTRRVVLAPRLLGSGPDGVVAIAREWYSWSPPESQGQNFAQETAVFRANLAGGVLSDATLLPAATRCGERVVRAGSLEGGDLWIVCARSFSNTIVIRRVDAAGATVFETSVSAATGVDGDTLALSADGDALFAWNPLLGALARIDLETGEKAEGLAPAAATSGGADPVAALGRWLAPSAAAKTVLRSGVVVSPDGRTVYAAGIDGVEGGDGMAGSTGIHVFDAATLTSLGRWEPTADFISLAVSANGRYVYAAGLAHFDAAGQSRPSQQASITVYDAEDGEVQLIAGELGNDFMTFTTPILD